MNIDKVTITGADDKVNPDDLLNLQTKFPFVEWGILLSKSREGQQRYPTMKWVTTVARKMPFLNISAHLCGEYAKSIVNGDFSIIRDLKFFNRVQVNYNFSKDPTHIIHSIVAYAALNEDKKIILQANNSNAHTISYAIKMMGFNCHLLYDSSGGRGKQTVNGNMPPFKTYTGYAGGINEGNIKAICHDITNNTQYPQPVWLDLESGARTNNEFDLNLVNNILELAAPFITTSPTPQ